MPRSRRRAWLRSSRCRPTIKERFSIELYPAPEAPAEPKSVTEEEQEVLSTPDVEPFENGRIDVGAFVYELLSAALDPYPQERRRRIRVGRPQDRGRSQRREPICRPGQVEAEGLKRHEAG